MSNRARKKLSKTQKSGSQEDDSSVELTISKVYLRSQKIQEAKQKNIIEFELSPDIKQKEIFKVRIQKVLCIQERRHLQTRWIPIFAKFSIFITFNFQCMRLPGNIWGASNQWSMTLGSMPIKEGFITTRSWFIRFIKRIWRKEERNFEKNSFLTSKIAGQVSQILDWMKTLEKSLNLSIWWTGFSPIEIQGINTTSNMVMTGLNRSRSFIIFNERWGLKGWRERWNYTRRSLR